MNTLTLQVPWILLLLNAILALVGLLYLLIKGWESIRFVFFLLKGGILPPEDSISPEETFILADKEAHKLLQTRIREVWHSFSPVQWLDLQILRNDCHALVQKIAGIYFPQSKQPELEITMLELLQFNERTAHRLRDLLIEFPSFHRLTIASILDAKSLLEKTRETIDRKGIKTGHKIASRIWAAINAINPNYWIQRFLFRGASEVIGRKVLTSVYRIVGVEAIRIYRASAQQLGPKKETVEEIIESGEIFDEPLPEDFKQPEDTSQSQFQESSFQEPLSKENHENKRKENSMNEEQEWIFPDEEKKSEEPSDKEETEKLGSSIHKMMSAFVEGTLHLWDKMVNEDKIIASYQKKGETVDCLSDIEILPLETIDSIADSYIRKGRWVTAAEGAATGFGGFLLLSADAVSLLALQLRTIQQIGYCYGFDVSRPEEKLFAAKLLAEAYNHPAGKEKDAIKREMRMAAGLLQGKTPFGLLQKRLFVQGFSKIAQKIGVRFGSRKATQIVPVLGSAVGSWMNQKITKEIAQTAKDVYRDRFLERKKYFSDEKTV